MITRSELGQLVSRGLAVWMLMNLCAQIPTLVGIFTQEHPVPTQRESYAIFFTLNLVVVLLLWFKASSFGSWNEVEVGTTTYEWRKLDVATAMIQGACLFWLLRTLAGFVTSVDVNTPRSAEYIKVAGVFSSSTWGDITLIGLSLFGLIFAKSLSKKL